ncbi:hypothetical protein HDU96_010511 [Phlyctochytrium bullatum]|nr:hypothetical protein HDU96_010511 [Phlyctochytrium bullatum]
MPEDDGLKLAEDANAVGINPTTSTRKRRRSSDVTEDAIGKEKRKELMAEEYRLPRFENKALDAAAQADLEKALAAIKVFFKDENPEARPEVREFWKWKGLKKSRFLQQIRRLHPFHSSAIADFFENRPAYIKELDSGQQTYHARFALHQTNLEDLEYRELNLSRSKEPEKAILRQDAAFIAISPVLLPVGYQLVFKVQKNLPNPYTLTFHRASCLVWRAAGGGNRFDQSEFELEYNDVGDEQTQMEEPGWNEQWQLSVQGWVQSVDVAAENADMDHETCESA